MSVLACAFDAKKKTYWNKEWTTQIFWGDLYPTTPSMYMVRSTSMAINLPEEKFKYEHMLQEFFLEEYPISLSGT